MTEKPKPDLRAIYEKEQLEAQQAGDTTSLKEFMAKVSREHAETMGSARKEFELSQETQEFIGQTLTAYNLSLTPDQRRYLELSALLYEKLAEERLRTLLPGSNTALSQEDAENLDRLLLHAQEQYETSEEGLGWAADYQDARKMINMLRAYVRDAASLPAKISREDVLSQIVSRVDNYNRVRARKGLNKQELLNLTEAFVGVRGYIANNTLERYEEFLDLDPETEARLGNIGDQIYESLRDFLEEIDPENMISVGLEATEVKRQQEEIAKIIDDKEGTDAKVDASTLSITEPKEMKRRYGTEILTIHRFQHDNALYIRIDSIATAATNRQNINTVITDDGRFLASRSTLEHMTERVINAGGDTTDQERLDKAVRDEWLQFIKLTIEAARQAE